MPVELLWCHTCIVALITVEPQALMLGLLVALQIGLVCCGIFTLITRILHVFVFFFLCVFQITIVRSFILTKYTFIGNSCVLRLLVHYQMTLVSCFIGTLVAEIADTLRSAIVSTALPKPVVSS